MVTTCRDRATVPCNLATTTCDPTTQLRDCATLLCDRSVLFIPVLFSLIACEFPNQHFGLGVFPFNAAHVITPGLFIVYIGHGLKVAEVKKGDAYGHDMS